MKPKLPKRVMIQIQNGCFNMKHKYMTEGKFINFRTKTTPHRTANFHIKNSMHAPFHTQFFFLSFFYFAERISA